VGGERPRRGQRERAARADGDEAVVRLDDLAAAGDEERALAVDAGQRRVEPAQRAVGAPLLGQRDAGALELPGVTPDLLLEAVEQRQGIAGGAGDAGEHLALALADAAQLARVRLDHEVAERDLPVGSEGGDAAVDVAEDGRGAEQGTVGTGRHGGLRDDAGQARGWAFS
jgi:hypothetical protein